MAKLSTHVLDTARGVPAAGVSVQLYRVNGTGRTLLAEAHTNADGRTEQPLLQDAALTTGRYELAFDVGAYFASAGLPGAGAFLEIVTLHVRLEAGQNYHVPLLVSPWAYSTYRGS